MQLQDVAVTKTGFWIAYYRLLALYGQSMDSVAVHEQSLARPFMNGPRQGRSRTIPGEAVH